MKNLVLDISYFIHRHVDSKVYDERQGLGGAMVAILLSVNKIMREVYPATRLWVCFDGEPIYRQNVFPEYKANRETSRNKDMSRYLTRTRLASALKEMFDLLGARVISHDSLEADDCAYLLAQEFKNRGEEALFATGDQDWLQILSLDGDFKVYSPRAGIVFDAPLFENTMGFPPKMLVYYKALCGDKSDNIPPVKRGLGNVTAKKIILENGCSGENIESATAIGEEHTVLQALTRNLELVDCSRVPVSQSAFDSILSAFEPKTRDDVRLIDFIANYKIGDRLDWLLVASRWKAICN